MNAYVAAILTETTCGEACWHAKEDICRCKCGGKNHGILRTPEGIQPVRTAKIDGHHYELMAVGEFEELYPQIQELMKSLPWKKVERITDTLTYHYKWETTDKGSPYRVKKATAIQAEHWPELTAFRGLDDREFYFKQPTLIWKLV
jgi:hypothetical protein